LFVNMKAVLVNTQAFFIIIQAFFVQHSGLHCTTFRPSLYNIQEFFLSTFKPSLYNIQAFFLQHLGLLGQH
jgi:hypothetical protein